MSITKDPSVDKWAGCLPGLDKSVHICMLLTKRMFLVMDKNVGLCLYMVSRFDYLGVFHLLLQ